MSQPRTLGELLTELQRLPASAHGDPVYVKVGRDLRELDLTCTTRLEDGRYAVLIQLERKTKP